MTFDEAEKYIYKRFGEAGISISITLNKDCDDFHEEELDKTFENIMTFIETKHKKITPIN